MEGQLAAAIAGVQEAFASYPRRALLEGCPHCRGSVLVDERDLFSLTISLGNTVGSREDVKSLLPVLFERLVTSDELDPSIVLGTLWREEWRTWPGAEQDAIDRYLEAVWRSLLADYPSQLGSFLDAVTFLDAPAAPGESRLFPGYLGCHARLVGGPSPGLRGERVQLRISQAERPWRLAATRDGPRPAVSGVRAGSRCGLGGRVRSGLRSRPLLTKQRCRVT
ncbi:hypothetical protein [Micromonospora sp. NPDC050495]|uniref:hypothetical protein n=1 Tax=Micromonospora sp. NPDC050495 TaxID=3154936 RepID=UPI0033FA9DB5